jgi:hypothetical protein
VRLYTRWRELSPNTNRSFESPKKGKTFQTHGKRNVPNTYKKKKKKKKEHEIIKDPPHLTWDKPLQHDAQMGNLGNVISCIQTLNQ